VKRVSSFSANGGWLPVNDGIRRESRPAGIGAPEQRRLGYCYLNYYLAIFWLRRKGHSDPEGSD